MITARSIVKTYATGAADVPVLRGVSLDVRRGTLCTVLGPSGSGKSTLLKCLSGLERFDSGTVTVAGRDVAGLSTAETARFRREDIAFVFQEHNLITDLTLRENIALDRPMDDSVMALAVDWGVEPVLDQFPARTSGGQQQKCALLRALNKKSTVLFCDEPTGALDAASTRSVLGVVQQLVADLGLTVVMITHNELATAISDQVVRLHDGTVVVDERDLVTQPAAEVDW